MIVKNKVVYFLLLISILMYSGCSSYSSGISSSDDIRNVSALEWRLGKKQEADNLLYSRQQTLQSRYGENSELVQRNRELDSEIERKQEIIRSLTYSIERYYSDIENNIDVRDNIDRIDESLKQIILHANTVARYVNKGKLFLRIQQAKSMRRKIALFRKGAMKMGAKSFLRMIPQVKIFVILWDFVDLLKPTKSPIRLKR